MISLYRYIIGRDIALFKIGNIVSWYCGRWKGSVFLPDFSDYHEGIIIGIVDGRYVKERIITSRNKLEDREVVYHIMGNDGMYSFIPERDVSFVS